ncbi:hypothetical protein H0B56_17240 [Haloechinothrix sp. YIM 98757]|uniref:Uncharacterized protein n=1 Tax=Haloechinothrix aidingensis TaxID=2752311 RepID=A0A838ADN1_9PSEU|nr:hypothetical protein [Haloechinothrix aidingensis]MBA0127297.1 hypothetical protein [Haloechinothrix aidingensis]
MSPPSFPRTPDSHEPIQSVSSPQQARRHRNGSGRRRGPAGVVPASVLVCHVAPDSGPEERIVAAVRVVVTAYSDPGDRVALADAAEPGSAAGREHRDRLVETVLRLARGAVTELSRPARGDDLLDRGEARFGTAPESGAESGPGPEQPPFPVGEPTARPATPRARERHPDRFAVIVCGCTRQPTDPGLMADWAPLLAPDGVLIVLTHSHHMPQVRTAHSGAIGRAATLAGLTPVDRLILAHDAPSAGPPTGQRGRRAVALGAHRRIHATACVFRPSIPSLEPCHA